MKVSVIKYGNLERTKRLDSEYYSPSYLHLLAILNKKATVSISEVCKVSDGNHMSISSYFQEHPGIPYFRGQDINTDFFLENARPIYIPEEVYEKNFLKRSFFKSGDVLLSIVGTIGSISLVTNQIQKSTGSCKIAILRPHKVCSEYLATFLMCFYGKQQVKRNTRGAVQTGIILEDMDQIQIWLAPKEFQRKISEIIQTSLEKNRKSKQHYHEAQTLLLSELGLLDWKPNHHLSFVKNYLDTQQAGRFDAEYYQPKYNEIVEAIKNYAGGWDTLDNLVSVKKCIEVGSGEYSDEGIPFVRVSNLSPFDITEEKYISNKLYSELTPNEEIGVPFAMSKKHQPKKGEILFSKDATPGIAYFLNEEPQKMIPSGGILRLKLKDKRVKPTYLTLVLNSLIVKEQINRDVGGSVILHWRPDQVKQTLIPILDEDKQEQIQQKVTESFTLRKQSKHLLECAKKAVEIAIEKSEEEAEIWLKEKVGIIDA